MRRGVKGRGRQRGQGLVEFALVVPVILLVVTSVAEAGLAYGNLHTLGYATREGARVGSALALGDVTDCTGTDPGDFGDVLDPSGVDRTLVAAVERILSSTSSRIDPAKVQEIRIFKATPSGGETSGFVNTWTYSPAATDVDPGPGGQMIDFTQASRLWPACARVNTGFYPDSIGVTVKYTYDFVTPFPSMLDAMAGGALSLTLQETTVMSLNPSI